MSQQNNGVQITIYQSNTDNHIVMVETAKKLS